MRAAAALVLLAAAVSAQPPDPRPKGAIHGTVVDTAGSPVPGAKVTAAWRSDQRGNLIPDIPDGFGVGMPSNTDETGSFAITGLPPGTYFVKTQCDPGRYRVLALAQAVRWGVPDDLEKVLLVLYQATEVELASKAAVKITVSAAPI
jgi:hypothetical protein